MGAEVPGLRVSRKNCVRVAPESVERFGQGAGDVAKLPRARTRQQTDRDLAHISEAGWDTSDWLRTGDLFEDSRAGYGGKSELSGCGGTAAKDASESYVGCGLTGPISYGNGASSQPGSVAPRRNAGVCKRR